MAYEKTKAAAEAAALKLLQRMKTPGWKTHIWNNMGWHYALQNGFVSLHASSARIGGDTYFAMISHDEGGSGGLSMWTKSGGNSFKDPNKAVEFAVETALPIMDHITTIRNRISALVKGDKHTAITTMVKHCARCTKNHRVTFVPLQRGCLDSGYEYWAMCPNTHEPILMKVAFDNKEKTRGSQDRTQKEVPHPDAASGRARGRAGRKGARLADSAAGRNR